MYVYVTKLPRRIELDAGDWSVSLKDISTPTLFDNVQSNTCKFKLIGFRQLPLNMSLPGKMYKTNQSVIDEMNRLTNLYNVQFSLRAVTKYKTVSIIVGNTHIFRPNKELSKLLGIHERDYILSLIHISEPTRPY